MDRGVTRGHRSGFRANPEVTEAAATIYHDRNQSQKGNLLDALLTIAIMVAAGWWFYKQGKHTGSRKGYHVGRTRQRRRK